MLSALEVGCESCILEAAWESGYMFWHAASERIFRPKPGAKHWSCRSEFALMLGPMVSHAGLEDSFRPESGAKCGPCVLQVALKRGWLTTIGDALPPAFGASRLFSLEMVLRRDPILRSLDITTFGATLVPPLENRCLHAMARSCSFLSLGPVAALESGSGPRHLDAVEHAFRYFYALST